jgi:DNA-binding beta-propeller fold protein YncE
MERLEPGNEVRQSKVVGIFVRGAILGLVLMIALIGPEGVTPRVSAAPLVGATISLAPPANAPWAVAVNPTTNRIYVTGEGGGVGVIDGASNSVSATISPTGPFSGPHYGIGVNPTTNRVYASNISTNHLTVIDGATDTIVTSIFTSSPGCLRGVAVNATTNRIYVTNCAGITVIDGTSNTVVTNISSGVGLAMGVAVNAATNRIYSSNSAGNVTVYDGGTNTVVTTIAIPSSNPWGIAVNELTNRVYVANQIGGSFVSVIDGATNSLSGSITGFPIAPLFLAVDQTTNRLYVTNGQFSGGAVSIVDTTTNTRQSVPTYVPYPVGVAVNSITGRVYVANYSLSTVSVLMPEPPMSFQGRLTDGSGVPVADGSYSTTFRIYDAPTGGTNLWEETQSVSTSGGVFSVMLGSSNPLSSSLFTGEPRYLEIQVASDPPMTPRERLTTVPFAFNAQLLQGMSPQDLVRNRGAILYIPSGGSCPAGFVGSGASPIPAGVNGASATAVCLSDIHTQVIYIGDTQTCPGGWTQVDINAPVQGTAPADACYR